MYNQENYLKMLVGVGVAAAVIQFILNGISGLNEAVRLISTSITVAFLFHLLFHNVLWKFHIFRPYIVKVPNLQGTWEGKIRSVGNSEVTEIDTKIIIRQTFTTISVEVQTSNMTSSSYIAGFCFHSDSGNVELSYSYNSKSKLNQREKNPWHEGSCKFLVNEGGKKMTMDGEYWTSRRTIGEIHVSKIS